MSIPSLPDDLIPEFLARLSPTPLMRFRCVSKSWRALIDSPEFKRMQLRHSTLHYNASDYVFRVHHASGYRICAARWDSAANFQNTLRAIKGSPLSEIALENSRLVGTCNGLICMEVKATPTRVILWNPWIRKSFELPYSRVQSKLSGYLRTLNRSFHYGFGYDDYTDDYKLVRLVQHQVSLHAPAWCEVKVYSLKSNSWKRLPEFPYAVSQGSQRSSGVLCNHALHCIVQGDSIAAIDLKSEEYRLVPMPEILTDKCWWDLGLLEGCLCILSTVYSDPNGTFVLLWVMKDYGRKDSWTKTLRVPVTKFYSTGYIDPIGYSEAKKQLVLHKKNQCFMWFYTEKARLCGETARIPCLYSTMEGCVCAGSLVQPFGGYGIKKGIKRTRK
ncbi:F-box protein CPR1-like [Coffea arabica]|uniref:F-box protein CPR1-like n=1 Tax=Coffea arabica TaxID=13443 RepID=A0A6P6S9F1_COFAR